MCLTNVTKKFKKHTVGYKIFLDGSKKIMQYKKICFMSPFQRSHVPFGTWVDARAFDVTSTQTDISRYGYYPGWHYYLKKKDALKIVSSGECIIKISVKNIICVGDARRVQDAGVSYHIKLDKVVYRSRNDLTFKQRDRAEMLTVKKLTKNTKSIFRMFNYKVRPTQELADIFVENLDLDTYEKLVNVIDSFSRDGFLFRYFTELHMISMRGNNETSVKYQSLYKALMKRLTPNQKI